MLSLIPHKKRTNSFHFKQNLETDAILELISLTLTPPVTASIFARFSKISFIRDTQKTMCRGWGFAYMIFSFFLKSGV